MKNINDIRNEISKLRTESSNQFTTDAVISSNRKKIAELTTVALYLETNPKEESLKNQLNKLSHQTEKILDRFPEWEKTSIEARRHKNPMNHYREINDIPRKCAQIEMLQYILS